MTIRRASATTRDMDGINRLLRQVLDIHHNGRPDLFQGNAKKYTDGELSELLSDDTRPVFVAVDTDTEERILGYAFCIFQQHKDSHILTDIRTLYIDDLCVEQGARGQHIGKTLYEYVLAFARANGFYNVTLNVWSCNPEAMKFYEHMGLVPYKVSMEKIL